MPTHVLSAKIRDYAPANPLEQENVLQELMQHYILASLSRAGFFSEAAFHGGTCLRIVNGLGRFSEDLDFLLKRPDPDFRWQAYLDAVRNVFSTAPHAHEDLIPEDIGRGPYGTAIRGHFELENEHQPTPPSASWLKARRPAPRCRSCSSATAVP